MELCPMAMSEYRPSTYQWSSPGVLLETNGDLTGVELPNMITNGVNGVV